MAPRTLDLPGTGAATHPPADFVGASVSALGSMRGLPDRQASGAGGHGTGDSWPGVRADVSPCFSWRRETGKGAER